MRIERGEDPGPYSRPRDYVTHLRVLFRHRCAYCLTPDDQLGRKEGMKVDHFHPESRRKDLWLAWSNLYYSCDTCNNRKSNHPKGNEASEGCCFVDPCADDPDDHFRLIRDPETGDFCRVTHLSPPADYTIRRLQFNRRNDLRSFWRELDAAERKWTGRIQNVLDLQANFQEPNPEAETLLADFEDELSRVRERRPFPLKR